MFSWCGIARAGWPLYRIYARRFDSSGSPLTPELQVNVQTAGEQSRPRIAATSNGRFVVVGRASGLQPRVDRRRPSSRLLGGAVGRRVRPAGDESGSQGEPAVAGTTTETSWWSGLASARTATSRESSAVGSCCPMRRCRPPRCGVVARALMMLAGVPPPLPFGSCAADEGRATLPASSGAGLRAKKRLFYGWYVAAAVSLYGLGISPPTTWGRSPQGDRRARPLSRPGRRRVRLFSLVFSIVARWWRLRFNRFGVRATVTVALCARRSVLAQQPRRHLVRLYWRTADRRHRHRLLEPSCRSRRSR